MSSEDTCVYCLFSKIQPGSSTGPKIPVLRWNVVRVGWVSTLLGNKKLKGIVPDRRIRPWTGHYDKIFHCFRTT